ncbi:MAG: winged helix-turn-helix transcriptional regulator [Mogibacterium sp.]|nr:winged helix-turn-helix transcriptional regulator [Mogibacterium sp.]
MRDNVDGALYASMLYDFYGELLSDSQREVTALYNEDNLSLSEIAEELGQSRQAVHYTLKKAEAALNEFEDKLGLIKTYENNQKLAEKAADMIDRLNLKENEADKLKCLIRELAE